MRAAVAGRSALSASRSRSCWHSVRLIYVPTPLPDAVFPPDRLRTARVIRVGEHACDVWSNGEVSSVGFAPMFPSPRAERVSPGNLVAIATGPDGTDVVVWRWYDAVVLGTEEDGAVRLWEPAHGEVIAQARASYEEQEPGSRAYASAGLPGAGWWVADRASGDPQDADVELDEVIALYTENDLWPAVFGSNT
jgi:hypothetical protein